MTNLIQVMTTVDSREEAQNIAQALVQRRLAGCVQVIGLITSIYWWQEEIETDEEWLCVVKSHQDLYPELEKPSDRSTPMTCPKSWPCPSSPATRTIWPG